jgi:3-isopropylmalate dehydrogenase
MKLKVLVLAGDGIGPEVTQQAVRVLKTVADLGGHDFKFDEKLIAEGHARCCAR